MNVILIMVDSLNRTYLSPYGAKIKTPNFERLAKRCVTMPVWRVKVFEKATEVKTAAEPDLLFDLTAGDDVSQDIRGKSPKIAARLEQKLVADLRRIQAPEEQFERLGLNA